MGRGDDMCYSYNWMFQFIKGRGRGSWGGGGGGMECILRLLHVPEIIRSIPLGWRQRKGTYRIVFKLFHTLRDTYVLCNFFLMHRKLAFHHGVTVA